MLCRLVRVQAHQMAKETSSKNNAGRRGGAMLELALMSPWVFFLFVGALDCGFYSYQLISVQNAARAAALWAAKDPSTAGDSVGACQQVVLKELQDLPNVGSSMSTCSGPVTVTATYLNNSGPDGVSATQVTVTYTSYPMIAIPGLLNNQFTFRATSTMRLLTTG